MFDKIDIELLRRYNEPGPRYTSYPTAPLFSEAFGGTEFKNEIVATNSDAARPLSLYFHLPFCHELCYFCACTMIVSQREDKKATYLDYIELEVDRVAADVHPDRKVEQLHWGGGTPTSYSPDQIRRLGDHIQKRFSFLPDAELSCELDPRVLTRDHLVALRDVGFNRVSMGVQDFNEQVQVAVNRVQPEKMTRQVIDWVRELGFNGVNLDFIYGLPHQTEASFEVTIDKLIDIDPDRIALFNFAYVPWLKKHHEKLIDADAMPSPESRLNILKTAIERLCRAGYVYIGMDHFAREDDELTIAQREGTLHRNFQGYSTKAGCDLYGFGMSAISQLDMVYAQNHKTLADYYGAIDAGTAATKSGYRLDEDDRIRREVITRLMCDFQLSPRKISSQFNIDFDEYFSASLTKMKRFVDDELISMREGEIVVTETGRLVIRNIAMCFDGHIDEMMDGKQVFSRTV